jgi:hypothetical protein
MPHQPFEGIDIGKPPGSQMGGARAKREKEKKRGGGKKEGFH